MDLEQLISTIVRQVLMELEQGGSPASGILASRTLVMVLAPRTDVRAASIGEQLEPDVDLRFLGEDRADNTPQRYILPFLTCNDMADLAAGKAAGPIMQDVLRLLLLGTAVEVMEFEYKAYADTAPGALYSLYTNYEKSLAAYGLVPFRAKKPEAYRLRDELITETSVTLAHDHGASTLIVPQTAIVTPLAMDAAKLLGMDIIKRL